MSNTARWTAAALVLAGGAAVWALFGTRPPEPDARLEILDRSEGPAEPPARNESPGPRSAADGTTEQRAAPVGLEKSFEGEGTLAGSVSTPPGTEFPREWTLVIEPARYLEGREQAVARRIEFEGGTREFRIDDLPLGGYEVRAAAEGMNGRREPVLLYRVAGRDDLPGRTQIVVHLVLERAGFLTGRVVGPDGEALEGVQVTLRAEGAGMRGREYTTRSEPSGSYLFDGLPDGTYEIVFGDPAHPLRGPEPLHFAAPRLSYPERELPRTVHVRFQVLDELGLPVPGAAIRGSGETSGSVDVSTDSEGYAVLPHLPLGHYRVHAEHPTGRRGKLTFTLDGDEREEFFEIIAK